MSIELEILDANCNNCKFMVRDLERIKIGLATHFKWQFDEFFRTRLRLCNIEMKKKPNENPDPKAHKINMKRAGEMKFQFDSKQASIKYGDCVKFSKPVSFIPDTCQLHTQDCFEHRKTP